MSLSNKLTAKKTTFIATLVGLYLLSTGISWAVFSFVRQSPGIGSGDVEQTRKKIGEGLPKTEECPMNGMYYSEPERQIWEGRRPITAIIENHHESRPPSGITKADIVYEAVSEGGITRFLGIFYCGTAAEEVQIAPVRSARVYFVNYATEYGDYPIFMHVGGANDYAGYGDTVREARALELLETLGWRVPRGNDFDTTYDSGFPVFWRNYERLDRDVATEHTMMASLDEAFKQAENRGFGAKDSEGNSWDATFKKWNFADGAAPTSPDATNIKFNFWEDGSLADFYDVEWNYDSAANNYVRENGGEPHMDLGTGEQIMANNVVILFAKERTSVDRNHHVLYTTIGTGDALVFQNGKAIEATWEKDSATARTEIFDETGEEVEFVRGPIWIELLPVGNSVDY
jgi:hypothetical protein